MGPNELRDALRQMLAVLESERQALAGLDLNAIIGATQDKDRLCGALGNVGSIELDDECRSMIDTAKRLNEVNRQVRNIIAANVTTRLNAIVGSPQVYKATPHYARVAGRHQGI